MWGWFCELSAARGGNGFGLSPISFTEIDAWARVTGERPTPWEVGLLRRIDTAILPKLSGAGAKDGVSVKDTAGMSALFSGLRARANEVFGK